MSTTSTEHRYQGARAELYERFLVPAFGEPVARRLLRSARLQPGERVLDVGCGTGIAARLAAAEVGPSGAVVGIDPDLEMLDVARTAPAPAGIGWRQGTAEDLPVADASIDVAVGSLSLQFVPDVAAALRRIHRALVPDGRAAFATAGPTPPPFAALAEVLGRHLGPAAGGFVQRVFSLADAPSLQQVAAESGFEAGCEAVHVTLHLGPPADFLWRYVNATPLRAAAAGLDAAGRAGLEREVVGRWAPFTEAGELVAEPRILITTARRSR